MNNKIYIIATAENKHLIIPYLESLGGTDIYELRNSFIEVMEIWFIDENDYIAYIPSTGYSLPEGYTEIHLKEQDGVICAYGAGGGVPPVVGGGGAGGEGFIAPIKYPNGGDIINPSELDKAMQMREETLRENASLFLQTEQLKKENEQLRNLLKQFVIEHDFAKSEFHNPLIDQSKQLLK